MTQIWGLLHCPPPRRLTSSSENPHSCADRAVGEQRGGRKRGAGCEPVGAHLGMTPRVPTVLILTQRAASDTSLFLA